MHDNLLRRMAPAMVLTAASLGLLRTLDVPTAAPVQLAAVQPTTDQTTAGVATAAATDQTTAEVATGQTTAGATEVATAQTLVGPSVSTRYGPVQVQATIGVDGTVLEATAVSYPTGDRRSAQISAQAVPRLDAAATAAGGTGFDGVSGATYTTDGYRTSLQAIIDAA